jgi:2-haloacid dehalogenase
MSRYQWILFDADGTLFDYEQAEANALESTFRDLSLGFSPQTAAAYQAINHQIWLDFEAGRITSAALRVRRFELLFETLAITSDPQAFSQHYLVHLSQQAGLMPGAQQVVEQLAGTCHLAIITNGLSDVQRPRLARSTIGSYFEAVFISEEMGVSKPTPAYFEAVFAALSEHAAPPSPENSLVVGDSLTSDIQGGRNFGLATCWFNPAGKAHNPSIPADFVISKLEELYNIV